MVNTFLSIIVVLIIIPNAWYKLFQTCTHLLYLTIQQIAWNTYFDVLSTPSSCLSKWAGSSTFCKSYDCKILTTQLYYLHYQLVPYFLDAVLASFYNFIVIALLYAEQPMLSNHQPHSIVNFICVQANKTLIF